MLTRNIGQKLLIFVRKISEISRFILVKYLTFTIDPYLFVTQEHTHTTHTRTNIMIYFISLHTYRQLNTSSDT
jgi:hypothetical protein